LRSHPGTFAFEWFGAIDAPWFKKTQSRTSRAERDGVAGARVQAFFSPSEKRPTRTVRTLLAGALRRQKSAQIAKFAAPRLM